MRKAALIYTSVTGNTEEVVKKIEKYWDYTVPLDVFNVEAFQLEKLKDYEAIIIGTYTWGDGEIPQEMVALYQAFENQDVKHIRTAVFGTGDSFYPNFCGAVNEFRDMLYVQTSLVATLKIELAPQLRDEERIKQLVSILKKDE